MFTHPIRFPFNLAHVYSFRFFFFVLSLFIVNFSYLFSSFHIYIYVILHVWEKKFSSLCTKTSTNETTNFSWKPKMIRFPEFFRILMHLWKRPNYKLLGFSEWKCIFSTHVFECFFLLSSKKSSFQKSSLKNVDVYFKNVGTFSFHRRCKKCTSLIHKINMIYATSNNRFIRITSWVNQVFHRNSMPCIHSFISSIQPSSKYPRQINTWIKQKCYLCQAISCRVRFPSQKIQPKWRIRTRQRASEREKEKACAGA